MTRVPKKGKISSHLIEKESSTSRPGAAQSSVVAADEDDTCQCAGDTCECCADDVDENYIPYVDRPPDVPSLQTKLSETPNIYQSTEKITSFAVWSRRSAKWKMVPQLPAKTGLYIQIWGDELRLFTAVPIAATSANSIQVNTKSMPPQFSACLSWIRHDALKSGYVLHTDHLDTESNMKTKGDDGRPKFIFNIQGDGLYQTFVYDHLKSLSSAENKELEKMYQSDYAFINRLQNWITFSMSDDRCNDNKPKEWPPEAVANTTWFCVVTERLISGVFESPLLDDLDNVHSNYIELQKQKDVCYVSPLQSAPPLSSNILRASSFYQLSVVQDNNQSEQQQPIQIHQEQTLNTPENDAQTSPYSERENANRSQNLSLENIGLDAEDDIYSLVAKVEPDKDEDEDAEDDFYSAVAEVKSDKDQDAEDGFHSFMTEVGPDKDEDGDAIEKRNSHEHNSGQKTCTNNITQICSVISSEHPESATTKECNKLSVQKPILIGDMLQETEFVVHIAPLVLHILDESSEDEDGNDEDDGGAIPCIQTVIGHDQHKIQTASDHIPSINPILNQTCTTRTVESPKNSMMTEDCEENTSTQSTTTSPDNGRIFLTYPSTEALVSLIDLDEYPKQKSESQDRNHQNLSTLNLDDSDHLVDSISQEKHQLHHAVTPTSPVLAKVDVDTLKLSILRQNTDNSIFQAVVPRSNSTTIEIHRTNHLSIITERQKILRKKHDILKNLQITNEKLRQEHIEKLQSRAANYMHAGLAHRSHYPQYYIPPFPPHNTFNNLNNKVTNFNLPHPHLYPYENSQQEQQEQQPEREH